MATKIIDDARRVDGSGSVSSLSPTPTAGDTSLDREKPPIPRSVTVAAVTLICFLSITAYWAGDITNALKSTVKEELNISNTQFSLLEASEDFMATILLLPSGIMADRLGGPVVMVFGKALYTLGTVLVAAAVTVRSYPFMVVGRIVSAFGDITTEIAEYKMFSSWFAPSQGFALLVALRHASAKAGALIGKGTANIIAKNCGLEWVFWIASFVNLFGNACTILFWLLNRHAALHYSDPKDPATQENFRTNRFELRKLRSPGLPWMFWVVMLFALFEAAASVTFSQNATELAEMRFGVGPVAAGWFAAVSQNGGLFFVPLLGMFLDRFGQRASVMLICATFLFTSMLLLKLTTSIAGTAASYTAYAVVRTMALTCSVDSLRVTLWEESIFGTALALKEVLNSTANLIVRLVTGKIQDADNNSYHRVITGYVVLSAMLLLVTLCIFGFAMLSPAMVPLQWSRRERIARGPAHISRIRQEHLERHGRRGAVVAGVCLGGIAVFLVASWGIYIWGAVTGDNQ